MVPWREIQIRATSGTAGCASDAECAVDQACVNGLCRDPCSLRAACGSNALCKVVQHRPRCECPECFAGRAHVRCVPRSNCITTVGAVLSEPQARGCLADAECLVTQSCVSGACANPCVGRRCADHERCVVQAHRPVCACKNKLAINAVGELSCPVTSALGCTADAQCPLTHACSGGACQNPCHDSLCPKDKACRVLEHKAVCMCTAQCEASICLKDRGCPADQACRSFQCVDPCADAECPGNTPCLVEDHKAICKFCPGGFVVDKDYGCLESGVPPLLLLLGMGTLGCY